MWKSSLLSSDLWFQVKPSSKQIQYKYYPVFWNLEVRYEVFQFKEGVVGETNSNPSARNQRMPSTSQKWSSETEICDKNWIYDQHLIIRFKRKTVYIVINVEKAAAIIRVHACCGPSVMSSFSWLWIVAHLAPLSMGYSRQEHWSGLPCPPPGNLPNPGIEPRSFMSPTLVGRFFTTRATWKALSVIRAWHFLPSNSSYYGFITQLGLQLSRDLNHRGSCDLSAARCQCS